MRNRATTLLLAMLLVPAGLAYAQDEKAAGDQPEAGSVDFGGQFTTTKGDEGRYERYKDLRTGGLLDAFVYNRATDAWQFNASASHVGYRDQRYLAQFWKDDRARITFMWDQIPLTYGVSGERDQFGFFNATRTPESDHRSTGSMIRCRRSCRRSARTRPPRRARRSSRERGRPCSPT